MKKLFLFFIISLIALAITQGQKGKRELQNVATRQEKAVNDIKLWQESYQALKPITLRMEKTFQPASNVQDISQLHDLLGIEKSGVITDPEKLIASKVDWVKQNGVDIGVIQVFVRTQGSSGLVIQASSFRKLLDGLKHLISREDLSIAGVSLITDKSNKMPTAVLDGFCVYLRNKEKRNE